MQDGDGLDERDRDPPRAWLHVLEHAAKPLGLLVGLEERVGLGGVADAPCLLIAGDAAVPAFELDEGQPRPGED